MDDSKNAAWLTLHATLISALSTEEAVQEWLHASNDWLGYRCPIDVFNLGLYSEVTTAADNIGTPFYVAASEAGATTGPKS